VPSSCPISGRNGTCSNPKPGPDDLRLLRFTNDGRGVLRETVKAALRMGHNYVGTEHLLLGILLADGDAARTLTGLGLTTERAEQGLAAELGAFQARRHAG
jgi:ATP-dependent Clp protease ATP-binding subunit ClpA